GALPLELARLRREAGARARQPGFTEYEVVGLGAKGRVRLLELVQLGGEVDTFGFELSFPFREPLLALVERSALFFDGRCLPVELGQAGLESVLGSCSRRTGGRELCLTAIELVRTRAQLVLPGGEALAFGFQFGVRPGLQRLRRGDAFF